MENQYYDYFGQIYRESEPPNSPNNKAYREMIDGVRERSRMLEEDPERYKSCFGEEAYLMALLVKHNRKKSLDQYLSEFP